MTSTAGWARCMRGGALMMTTKYTTIRVAAARYEDEDDCLVAAAKAVARERDLMGWDLDPRWEDDQREIILLDIPAYAVRATDDALS